MNRFDRRQLHISPLAERKNSLEIEKIAVSPEAPVPALGYIEAERVVRTAERIVAARKAGKSVMLTYGAHLIKNGLGPVVVRLLEEGWVTHVATNGAGSIHDWEFAFLGQSSEDVRANVAAGQFGTWEETGRAINLSVAVGGIADLGYGASVGKTIAEDGIVIPSVDGLRTVLAQAVVQQTPSEQIGALADLLYLVTNSDLPDGKISISHPYKKYSVQYAAYRLGLPCTVHPGIGYDIIYTHPLNCGGAIGRAAVRDFLSYADSVSMLDGGVHLSVGSAIMAPMIFEKSMSMSNNLALQRDGKPIANHYLVVNDIQEGGDWDWSQGEPPKDHPAYYLRFCKTFHRMGGELDYICLDNRAFLLALYGQLRECTVEA
ncbi:MAG: GSU2086 family protein [Armatimonadota bacterium]